MGTRKVLEEMFDYEIVDEFLDHLGMVVDSIEVLTIQLEKSEYYERNVNELFRIFHNVKSASGYLKLTLINEFTISVEDLLEKMRKLDGPASSELVDWFLVCDDQMNEWNTNLRLDEDLAPLREPLKTIPSL